MQNSPALKAFCFIKDGPKFTQKVQRAAGKGSFLF